MEINTPATVGRDGLKQSIRRCSLITWMVVISRCRVIFWLCNVLFICYDPNPHWSYVNHLSVQIEFSFRSYHSLTDHWSLHFGREGLEMTIKQRFFSSALLLELFFLLLYVWVRVLSRFPVQLVISVPCLTVSSHWRNRWTNSVNWLIRRLEAVSYTHLTLPTSDGV